MGEVGVLEALRHSPCVSLGFPRRAQPSGWGPGPSWGAVSQSVWPFPSALALAAHLLHSDEGVPWLDLLNKLP